MTPDQAKTFERLLKRLSDYYASEAKKGGYTTMYDQAIMSHFAQFAQSLAYIVKDTFTEPEPEPESKDATHDLDEAAKQYELEINQAADWLLDDSPNSKV